jgi:hypothetical protein
MAASGSGAAPCVISATIACGDSSLDGAVSPLAAIKVSVSALIAASGADASIAEKSFLDKSWESCMAMGPTG